MSTMSFRKSQDRYSAATSTGRTPSNDCQVVTPKQTSCAVRYASLMKATKQEEKIEKNGRQLVINFACLYDLLCLLNFMICLELNNQFFALIFLHTFILRLNCFMVLFCYFYRM